MSSWYKRINFDTWPEKEIFEDGESMTACGLKSDFPTKEEFLDAVLKKYGEMYDKAEETLPTIDDICSGIAWSEDAVIFWSRDRRPRDVETCPAWICDLEV